MAALVTIANLAAKNMTPYSLTKDEMKMMKKDYKKPKARKYYGKKKQVRTEKIPLDEKNTISSKRKQKMSSEIAEFWYNLEEEDDGDEDDIEGGVEGMEKDEGREPLATFIKSSRKMFLLQYQLEIKISEKKRLEMTMKTEEMKVRKSEVDLKLAEQSFDQFLQESDRKAMESQRKAEHETKIRAEKDEDIKKVDNKILALKADIYNLKDVMRQFTLYGKFLHTISPEDWQQEQAMHSRPGRGELDLGMMAVLQFKPGELLDLDCQLYFRQPDQLLEFFRSLEEENLCLIQECQEASSKLDQDRSVAVDTRKELNQQAENLKDEIKELEGRMKEEKDQAEQVEAVIDSLVSGRKGGEDKVLDDLERLVTRIYRECVGENEAKIATIDMLQHVERRMEGLTQEQELLQADKVEVARVACERDRRARERQARMEKQKALEEERNKAALNRALAPPFRPQGRRPVFRSLPVSKDKQKS